jgi:glycosyltransferase involved in cell wall biosynthesis
MRVLHVIARMNVGGTANYVSKVVQGIPESKIVIGNVQDYEIEDRVVNSLNFIRINSLGRKISVKNDIRAFFALRKIIKELKPEIVHSHTFKAGLLARLIKGDFKKVHTFHGHLFDDNSFSKLQKVFIVFVERFLSKKTDALIGVGEKVIRELISWRVGNKNHWVSIPPGISPLKVLDKNQSREILGVKSGVILVGWLARQEIVKNPELFLQVARRFPHLQFVMGGGGPLLEHCQKTAPENCKVVGWTDPEIFWSAVDVCVSTSMNEGMPISLIEAQSVGVPVIATDVGSTREVIIDRVTGYLCNQTESDLTDKLKNITFKNDIIKKMGREAKLNTEVNFKVETLIKRHLVFYNNLINETKNG